jgi:hypothetical protein
MREVCPTHLILDDLGFSPQIAMGITDWSVVPDTPGVYVLFEDAEVIYVGMAGRDQKGSLRRRLRDHASGQIVNMFAQYLLFMRLLPKDDRPSTPREATLQCRAYIRAHCTARVLSSADKSEAVNIERRLRSRLQPTFNRIENTGVAAPDVVPAPPE